MSFLLMGYVILRTSFPRSHWFCRRTIVTSAFGCSCFFYPKCSCRIPVPEKIASSSQIIYMLNHLGESYARIIPWKRDMRIAHRASKNGHILIWFSYEVFPKIMVPPKSSILIGFSIINHPFWGTHIFGNPHMRWTGSWKIQHSSLSQRTMKYTWKTLYGCFQK